ncbi:hypothetical protein OKW50_004931 [Paraburkholderia youngii]|uniref:hypothetical protein n=1 Tax=Paraburkholderia youngii TaxID=2782701 RepID=UPI003D1BBFF4
MPINFPDAGLILRAGEATQYTGTVELEILDDVIATRTSCTSVSHPLGQNRQIILCHALHLKAGLRTHRGRSQADQPSGRKF